MPYSQSEDIEAFSSRQVRHTSERSGSREPDSVDRVVAELQRLIREATVDLSLRVGALIINSFYEGQVEGWRKRRHQSLRRLAQHPELPMSVSGLQRCIGLYELTQRLGDLGQFPTLGTSHFRAVFGLPQDVQGQLLRRANAESWTVLELESRAAKHRLSSRKKGGRPRIPELVKVMRGLKPLAEQGHWAPADELEQLSELELQEVTLLAERARRALDGLQTSIAETISVRDRLKPR